MSAAASCPSPHSCLTFPGTLLWGPNSLPISLLVDSGVDDNFVDERLARRARIPAEELDTPCTMLDLDGKPIASVTPSPSSFRATIRSRWLPLRLWDCLPARRSSPF